MGEVASGQLKEVSGMCASRRHPGILWVHNDGDDGRLFALSTNGQSVAVLRPNVPVQDLEDIAAGPGPLPATSYLYLGDIGDNESKRRTIRVCRVPEPELPAQSTPKEPAPLAGAEVFTLRYPDGPRDAEALLCDPLSGDLIIVTKQKRRARVYVASAKALAPTQGGVLVFLGELGVGDVSAGDFAPDGRSLLLRREDAAFAWFRPPGEALARTLVRVPHRARVIGPPDEPNGESIAFSADGSRYFTLSEGKRQPIYSFPAPVEIGRTKAALP